MSRSLLNHAKRWTAVGLLTILAISGIPGIAAACEGTGKGEIKFAEKGNPRTGTFTNPFATLEIEVLSVIKLGAGAFVGGTCKAGLVLLGAGTCTVIQEEPVGADVEYLIK